MIGREQQIAPRHAVAERARGNPYRPYLLRPPVPQAIDMAPPDPHHVGRATRDQYRHGVAFAQRLHRHIATLCLDASALGETQNLPHPGGDRDPGLEASRLKVVARVVGEYAELLLEWRCPTGIVKRLEQKDRRCRATRLLPGQIAEQALVVQRFALQAGVRSIGERRRISCLADEHRRAAAPCIGNRLQVGNHRLVHIRIDGSVVRRIRIGRRKWLWIYIVQCPRHIAIPVCAPVLRDRIGDRRRRGIAVSRDRCRDGDTAQPRIAQ